MAVRGIASTGLRSGRTTATRTNIPARSMFVGVLKFRAQPHAARRRVQIGIDGREFAFKNLAGIRVGNRRALSGRSGAAPDPAAAAKNPRTAARAIAARRCSGQRRADSPRFTSRMPSLPANGARMVFLAMVARMASALAWFCFSVASAVSSSDCETVLSARNFRVRSKVCFASCACASAARNCASSDDVSSRTSKSPCFTVAPDSKAISLTVPAISGATVTPCAALTEPTAGRVSGHFSSCATADATVSGGGAIIAAAPMSVLICKRFHHSQRAGGDDHDRDSDK